MKMRFVFSIGAVAAITASCLQEASGFLQYWKRLGRCRPIKYCEGESGVIL